MKKIKESKTLQVGIYVGLLFVILCGESFTTTMTGVFQVIQSMF